MSSAITVSARSDNISTAISSVVDGDDATDAAAAAEPEQNGKFYVIDPRPIVVSRSISQTNIKLVDGRSVESSLAHAGCKNSSIHPPIYPQSHNSPTTPHSLS